MKKKRFAIVLSICLIFFCAIMFAGCSLFGGDDDTQKKGTLKAEMIEIYGSFYYDGTEQTPDSSYFTITYKNNRIASTAFEYEFWDNIEVGTAYVRVTAREDNRYLTGSAIKTFEILPGYGQTDVTTFDELVDVLNGNHYAVARINQNMEIPAGYTLTIHADKHMDIESGNVVTNNGTIVVENDGGLSNLGEFINKSNITGEGQIYNSGVFFNSGNISNNLKTIQNWGRIYSNTELNYTNLGPSYDKGSFILREALSSENISLKNVVDGKFTYNSTDGGKAKIQATKELGYYSEVTYNITEKIIGNASVNIVALDKNPNYYGSLTLNYEVVKGETTCNSSSSFLTAKESGYYNKYTFIGIYPSVDDEVTIDEDETIIVSQSISFYGKVTNNGLITANTMATFDDGLENNGTIKAEKLNCRKNTLNTGTISFETDKTIHLIVSGTFVNSGTVTATSIFATSNTEISNSGIMTIDNSSALSTNPIFFDDESRIVNNLTGVITFAGKASFDNINISNSGTIVNNGNFDIRDNYTEFTNTGTFDNSNGQIWAFDQMKNKGITENIHFRTRLTDAEVALDEDTFAYDTYSHKPLFTVDGNTLDSTKYSIRYARVSGTADKVSGEIKNVGEIGVTITISNYDFEYGGSITLSYTITPGTIEVATYSRFASAVKDANYGNIVLTSDIVANQYEYLTIQQNQTVDTNGYTFTWSTYTLTNKGTIILGYIGDDLTIPNCALHISAALSNQGTIINNSTIFIDTSKYLTNSGSIQNNGKIFTWYNCAITTTPESTGHVYVRQALNAATSTENGAVNLSYYETDYNEGAQLLPTVTIISGSTTLDNNDFNISFSNNVNAGTANVAVSPKSDFNEYFVGSVTAHFEINKISHNVTESEINSTNRDNFFDDTNYYKYVLTRNVTVRSTVSVPAGLTIDMKQYRFTQGDSSARINLGENVQIFMETNQLSDFQSGNYYQYVATKITLNGNVGTNGTSAIIEHSLDNESVDNNTFFVGEDPYNFTLDLNGYNLYARISLYQNCKKRVDVAIINSSTTKKSTVGYTNQSYSIEQNGANGKDAHITINNIRMNSLWITSHNIQTINVSNCIIENTYSNYMTAGIALYIYNVRDYKGTNGVQSCLTTTSFTNCTFTGYTACYINGGHHTFTNCTFTSNGTNYRTFTDQYFKRNCNALTIHYITEPMSVDITGGSMSKTDSSAYLIEVIKNRSGTLYADTQSTRNSYSGNSGYHFSFEN